MLWYSLPPLWNVRILETSCWRHLLLIRAPYRLFLVQKWYCYVSLTTSDVQITQNYDVTCFLHDVTVCDVIPHTTKCHDDSAVMSSSVLTSPWYKRMLLCLLDFQWYDAIWCAINNICDVIHYNTKCHDDSPVMSSLLTSRLRPLFHFLLWFVMSSNRNKTKTILLHCFMTSYRVSLKLCYCDFTWICVM